MSMWRRVALGRGAGGGFCAGFGHHYRRLTLWRLYDRMRMGQTRVRHWAVTQWHIDGRRQIETVHSARFRCRIGRRTLVNRRIRCLLLLLSSIEQVLERSKSL